MLHLDAWIALSDELMAGGMAALSFQDGAPMCHRGPMAEVPRLGQAWRPPPLGHQASEAEPPKPPATEVIAVCSGKGGVGKSTVAANVAIALARSGKKVGLVDADVYGPSQPTLLGTDAKPTAADDRLIPVEAHGLKFLSLGQLVSPGHALAWRGPMATGALARLIDADWGDAEVLVVDLPPGTGDVQLSLIQKSRPDGAVVVSTPQDLSLIDATRAIDLFRKMDVPVLGIVENMAGYICPHCGEASDPFGSGGAEAAAAEMGVPFLGRLPLSATVRAASDAGNPPALGDGPESDAFAALAQKIVDALETVRR
jgi:ATP-binding protein involved in chromosome partitioning